MRFSIFVAMVAVVFVTVAGASAEVMYTVTDLGTLGGSRSEAYGIGERGEVLGYARIPYDRREDPFLWQNGEMTSVGMNGIANAVNSSGQIIGYTFSRDAWHATLWSNGQMTDLGTLGGFCSYPSAINSAGHVVGRSDVSGGSSYESAFLWQDGAMINLGTLPGCAGSRAVDINDRGQIVGSAQSSQGERYAFLWEGGTMRALPLLPGWASSYALSIDSTGRAFGTSNQGGVTHVVSWTEGLMSDLGAIPWYSSTVLHINQKGEAVGSFVSPSGQHAMLFKGGTEWDLNELIDPSLKCILNSATAINEAGQIVANGYFAPDGFARAFLLTPVPEPSSALLLLLGAFSLLRKR